MALGENAPAALVAEYARAAASLFPRGIAWAQGLMSNLRRLLEAEADSLARVDVRASDILDEADPRTATELLVDWEKTLGLPNPCSAIPEILQLRRAALVAKMTGTYGQSPAAYLALAGALGWDLSTVTISEERSFRVGISGAGEPLGGEDWALAWTVTAPEQNPTFFRAGLSSAGDRLVETNNELLSCFLEELAPAHTAVAIEFTDQYLGYSPWTDLTPDPAVLELASPAIAPF